MTEARDAPLEPAPDTEAVSLVKLPQFWEENPALWFLQIEALFGAYKIKSEAGRFQALVGQLPYQVLTQIAGSVQSPGPVPYTSTKEKLIAIYSQSQERRILRLLEQTQLGDMTPSQLLRQMQNQAGTAMSDGVLRTVWLRALPQRVRGILAAIEQDDLDKLATVADKVMEVDSNTSVHAVRDTDGDRLARLEKQLQDLHEQFSSLATTIQRSNRGRSRSRNRDQGAPKDGYCYYHHKFGEKATKCKKPCKWETTSQPSTNGTR